MLVLSRKLNEQIVINLGDKTVVVRVVGLSQGCVRLGISAPADVAVHREEVARRIAEWERETQIDPATEFQTEN